MQTLPHCTNNGRQLADVCVSSTGSLYPLNNICPLAELAVTFDRYIGANFSSKWFRLTNQFRKKGRKIMVTEPLKMILLGMN